MQYICDRCGQPIFERELRYVARIEVVAAYDPLQMTFEDLQRDYKEEIRRVIEQTQSMSEEELMRDVHVTLKFDLCRPCQKAWLKQPLGLSSAD